MERGEPSNRVGIGVTSLVAGLALLAIAPIVGITCTREQPGRSSCTTESLLAGVIPLQRLQVAEVQGARVDDALARRATYNNFVRYWASSIVQTVVLDSRNSIAYPWGLGPTRATLETAARQLNEVIEGRTSTNVTRVRYYHSIGVLVGAVLSILGVFALVGALIAGRG